MTQHANPHSAVVCGAPAAMPKAVWWLGGSSSLTQQAAFVCEPRNAPHLHCHWYWQVGKLPVGKTVEVPTIRKLSKIR